MSWIINLLKKNPSIIQIEKLANYMAHSKDEQGKYKNLIFFLYISFENDVMRIF